MTLNLSHSVTGEELGRALADQPEELGAALVAATRRLTHHRIRRAHEALLREARLMRRGDRMYMRVLGQALIDASEQPE